MSQGETSNMPRVHQSLSSAGQVLALFALMGALDTRPTMPPISMSRKAARAAKKAEKEANWRDRR